MCSSSVFDRDCNSQVLSVKQHGDNKIKIVLRSVRGGGGGALLNLRFNYINGQRDLNPTAKRVSPVSTLVFLLLQPFVTMVHHS